MTTLPRVDPEVAAKTFRIHLDQYWAARQLAEEGWEREELDPLHVVVTIPAVHESGRIDPYYVRLGAEYYDVYPPTVLFVQPVEGWPRARAGTGWWPRLDRPSWLGFHDNYRYADGSFNQLVCFSMTAEYYMTNHKPTPTQRWTQGRHTVAATLSRLREVLRPPYYKEPDYARNS